MQTYTLVAHTYTGTGRTGTTCPRSRSQLPTESGISPRRSGFPEDVILFCIPHRCLRTPLAWHKCHSTRTGCSQCEARQLLGKELTLWMPEVEMGYPQGRRLTVVIHWSHPSCPPKGTLRHQKCIATWCARAQRLRSSRKEVGLRRCHTEKREFTLDCTLSRRGHGEHKQVRTDELPTRHQDREEYLGSPALGISRMTQDRKTVLSQ